MKSLSWPVSAFHFRHAVIEVRVMSGVRRQVAVRADMQGRGIGAKLLAYAEAEARKRNYPQMILYARNAAIPFYERIGYVAEGDFFEEVGMPHIIMRKVL